ncbi:MAG: DNA topoisomerase VI subunit B [Thermoplasmata archaeon]
MAGTPIAEELAKKQREISVAEFFERNKQLLGFDSPTRAMLTSVKEAVDNSLDACEEAGILPEILVEIHETGKGEYTVAVQDNGPGIVKAQIPSVFGKLLYGSRFHAIRQSRGQQGIGISAVVMYAQLTTGKPTKVISKIGPDHPAQYMELILDTKKNAPEVLKQEVILWKDTSAGVEAGPPREIEHGTRVEFTIKARYIRGKQSVYDYLRSSAIVNPHARIILIEPDGTRTIFDRATEKMPPPSLEIKPHPEGIELGTLLKMAKETEAHKMTSFLVNDFSRVSLDKARQICEKAGVAENLKPRELDLESAKKVLEAFRAVKLMAPPTDCLSPIGETLIKKGMKKDVNADFVVTHTRPPSVYSGNPFQVEAGLMYGGSLNKDEPATILRFANRVPLLFQQGGCAITHAIENIDWRRYGLEQKGGKGIPIGPVLILVHVACTKIPFTSESKEAIADVPEILTEVELAVRECARKMQVFTKKRARLAKLKEKEEIIRKLLPIIAEKSAHLLGKPVPPIEPVVAKIMNSVLVREDIQYEAPKKLHHVRIEVVNFTPSRKRFRLLSVVPSDALVQNFSPKPESVNNHVITWELRGLGTMEKLELRFDLMGLDKEDFEECELYVKDIDPELVNGAEPWDPEAYERKLKELTEEEAEEGEEGIGNEDEPQEDNGAEQESDEMGDED